MAKFSKMQVMAAMKETGMVPVFFNKDVEICKNVIKACYEGGVRVFEFTNRGDFAHEILGELVKPDTPNGYKFESLVLDMIHQMDSCLPFEVVRRKEFAPIKNKIGVDSVESARELLTENGVVL
jgi:hypothetical protein